MFLIEEQNFTVRSCLSLFFEDSRINPLGLSTAMTFTLYIRSLAAKGWRLPPTFLNNIPYIKYDHLQTWEFCMDDVEAIRGLKRGEIGGLEVLVARYQAPALATAYLITQEEALAEDVVQEVFVHLYQHLQRFEEDRPFRPYLLRSVVHAALDAVAQRARWLPYPGDEAVEALGERITQAASVEDQVELAQRVQAIAGALRQLPARQRAAIVQRYYLGMSEAEMAEAQGAAAGTVKWLLNAARTRLRALLGSERSAE